MSQQDLEQAERRWKQRGRVWMQADRRYPVGRGEDRKGCLKENKQETEEQSAAAVLGADRIVLCMGVLKGSSRER